MYAAISADIVSSTAISKEDTIRLKQRISDLFRLLETLYPDFWGRQIKGDYIECLTTDVSKALRIALLIKSCIKSFDVTENKHTKGFQMYGVRMAIGIGDMRIVDREQGIMDGEAIYLSGRNLEKIGTPNKGTLLIVIENESLSASLRTVGTLTDAIINNCTKRQSEVIYYKLLSMKEVDIAKRIGIKQSSVNEHSMLAKWYCIEEALNYFEQIKFEDYE